MYRVDIKYERRIKVQRQDRSLSESTGKRSALSADSRLVLVSSQMKLIRTRGPAVVDQALRLYACSWREAGPGRTVIYESTCHLLGAKEVHRLVDTALYKFAGPLGDFESRRPCEASDEDLKNLSRYGDTRL